MEANRPIVSRDIVFRETKFLENERFHLVKYYPQFLRIIPTNEDIDTDSRNPILPLASTSMGIAHPPTIAPPPTIPRPQWLPQPPPPIERQLAAPQIAPLPYQAPQQAEIAPPIAAPPDAPQPISSTHDESDDSSDDDEQPEDPTPSPEPPSETQRRSTRSSAQAARQRLQQLKSSRALVVKSHLVDYDNYEPISIDDALSTPNADKWKEAIQTELDSLVKHKVLELVTLPLGSKCVGSRWVFVIKNRESSDPRFKARFVAQGFSQTYGEDYLDTYAPVVHNTTVRTIISFATAHKLKMEQFDIETALLNSDIDFHIYLRQPRQLLVQGKEHLVYQVNRALYGLKQSPYLWNRDFKRKLAQIGFTEATETDESVFLAPDVILMLYVDDIVIFSKHKHLIDQVISKLRRFFIIKALVTHGVGRAG